MLCALNQSNDEMLWSVDMGKVAAGGEARSTTVGGRIGRQSIIHHSVLRTLS
jgi:hypothetical protein